MAAIHGIFLIICIALLQLGETTYLKREENLNEKYYGLTKDCGDSGCAILAPEEPVNLRAILHPVANAEVNKELFETLIKRSFDTNSDMVSLRQNKPVLNNGVQDSKILNSMMNGIEAWSDNRLESKSKKRSGNCSDEKISSIKRKWANRPRVWGKRGKMVVVDSGDLEFQDSQLIDGFQEKNEQVDGMWNKSGGDNFRLRKRDDMAPLRWNYRPKVWGKRTVKVQDYSSS